MTHEAEQLQREYYGRTAHRYESLHCREGDEHFSALESISRYVESLGITSMVDVGTGTGRAVRFLKETHPDLRITGVEPIRELIDQGIRGHPATSRAFIQGRGDSLPFGNESFDAACQCGVLHHVPEPDLLVREMMRVSRKAVFLSDSNRFGQGGLPARLMKLALYKAGLWGVANWLKTRGRGYSISEGDGVSYSYSVYDSYGLLAEWADEMILLPTKPAAEGAGRSRLNPLITSEHLLLCAIRNIGRETRRS